MSLQFLSRSLPLLLGCLAFDVPCAMASAQDGVWSSRPSMPTARWSTAGGVSDGLLYVVGGATSSCGRTGALDIYDPATNAWTTGAPMPTAREGFDIGVIDGILYVVGGHEGCGSPALGLVQAYDPSSDSWTTVAPMPTPRGNLRVGVVDGILYAIGANNAGIHAFAPNEAYDPVTDTWTARAPMPRPRYAHSIAEAHGILYVMGGTDGVNPLPMVDAYDPATDTWSVKAPMPVNQVWTSAATVNGIIYVVGGVSPTALSGLVQAYDPIADQWSTVSSMPTPRSDLAVEAIDGVVYAAGGYNTLTGYAGSRVVEAFAIAMPPEPPLADAGADQTVSEAALVFLDGSASSDPEGGALAFQWTQVAGPAVTLLDPATATPSFYAPSVPLGGATLTMQLIVNNGVADSVPDTVDVSVKNVNNPPLAFAGDDQAVAEGALVILDGSDSADLDNDPLDFAWVQVAGSPVLLADAGAAITSFVAPFVGPSAELLVFELAVHDGMDVDVATIQILVENVNHPPIANAGPDQTRMEGADVVLDGSASLDPDLDPIGHTWIQVGGPTVALQNSGSPAPEFTAPEVSSAGATLVFELVVSDGLDFSAPDAVTVHVLDTNAPPLVSAAVASVPVLWPPDHSLIPIQILGVSDPNNDAVLITVNFVTQDEPASGLGEGDTGPDAVQQGSTVLIRAERSGTGNGRVYTIHFTATDAQGGACQGSVQVSVPHSRGRGGAAVDSGQIYDSN